MSQAFIAKKYESGALMFQSLRIYQIVCCCRLCQALGVLPPERPASGYWPVDFGEAATTDLPLVEGASLGQEIPIDFHTPAVDAVQQHYHHRGE